MSRHRAGGPGVEREAAVLDAAVPGAAGAELRVRGERSAVYRVVDAEGVSVAVKMIAAESLGVLDRNKSGTSADAGRVPVLRTGVHDGLGYLVMPYLPTSLADLVDGTPIAATELARLLGPVADALTRLHDAGFVHGDLKPTNLLLAGPDGPALLGDLDAVVERGTVPVRFTAGFAAPEWAGGAPAAATADTYGFAATVATALLGGTDWIPDLGGASHSGAAAAVVLPDSIPLAARAAITLGLSVDPAARVVSVTGIVAALAASGSESAGSLGAADPPVPATRTVLTPVPVAARGDGTPYPSEEIPVTRAASPTVDAANARGPGGGDELVLAAQQVWGFVDLRAATRDRLPLQVQPPAVEVDLGDDGANRSIWRHPAMLTSLVLAALLVALSVVLLLR